MSFRTIPIIYMLLFLPLLSVKAQEQAAAVPFLTFPTDARTTGMGATGSVLPGNPFALFRNASSAVFSEEKARIGYSYTPWNPDLVSKSSLNALGAWLRLGQKQVLLIGFRHFSHGEIPTTDENGNSTGNFTPKDLSVDLGYSYRVGENLSLGLGLDYIRSNMGDFGGTKVASAFALNFSATYHSVLCSGKPGSFWSAGLSVNHIGSKIKYLTSSYDLPAGINLGGAICYPFSEKHTLTGNLELGYQEMLSDTKSLGFGIGAEYNLFGHYFIRAGYHSSDKIKSSGNYATTGAGIEFNGARIDFAYLIASAGSALKNTWQLGLSIGIN